MGGVNWEKQRANSKQMVLKLET